VADYPPHPGLERIAGSMPPWVFGAGSSLTRGAPSRGRLMPPPRLDVALDGASARLLALLQAALLDASLPKESGRQLVDLAKAVRAYGIAREYDLAKSCLDAIMAAIGGADLPLLGDAVARHVSRVRQALR
jgi:hypothetical protein